VAISILLARALIEGVGNFGVTQDQLLSAASFDPKRIDHADGRISSEEYDSLVECAMDLTKDEALGLHFGIRTTPAAHQLIAHLVTSAGTLRNAMDAIMRFQLLLMDKALCRLEESAREARVIYEITPGSARCRRFRAEMAMTGFSRIVQQFERSARPSVVAFEHSAPAYREEYTKVFRGAERFDQPFTGIAIDRELLGATQLHADMEFHRVLEAQAETRVARLDRTKPYAERVREYLLDGTKTRCDDMEGVARGLGLSVRTLRRRLQEEGATYGAIAGSAFVALAKRLLVDEARSVEETAYAMGYATPTSFHRALKRWTGMTPKAFRTQYVRASRP
jgi:AraC-like DNA-binding protein